MLCMDIIVIGCYCTGCQGGTIFFVDVIASIALHSEGIYVSATTGGITNFIELIVAAPMGFTNGCGKMLISLVNFHVLSYTMTFGPNYGV